MEPSKLSARERQVLGALIMDKDKDVEARTVEAVALRTGLPPPKYQARSQTSMREIPSWCIVTLT